MNVHVADRPPDGGPGRLLEYALKYAAHGWPVLPLKPRDKVPLGRFGLAHATTDEETIRAWFTRWPDANIGVAMEPAGLAAIDIDPRNGGAVGSLPEQLDTLTARTGGGGEHLVVRVPVGTSLPGKLAGGIDVKHRGYIVVEPSIHPSGAAYKWVGWKVLDELPPQIADAPPWLLGRQPPPSPGPAGGSNWLDSLLRGENVHESALRLVGRMVAIGMDDESIRAWFVGIAPIVAVKRGVERAQELTGPELDRMLAGARRKGFAPTAQWNGAVIEPVDILRDVPVPSFAEADVPAPVWNIAQAHARASGFDPNGAILGAVVAAAAMIDDRQRLLVRPGGGWFESARLWGVIIGGPSAGKTPTIRASTDPVKEMHRELVSAWAQEHRGAGREEDVPPSPALYTSNTTVEKLVDILRGNPRGICFLTEEFASWLGGIDAPRNGASIAARGDWLQLYDGGAHQVDRVMRGSIFVPNWSCSVLAAATPAGLRAHLKSLPDDGLIHRFMPVIMRRPGAESASGAKSELDGWAFRLRHLYDRTTTSEVRLLRFACLAQAMFDQERRAILETVEALEEIAPALASHVGKHSGMLARVALTFHLLEQNGKVIEPHTVEAAIRFMRVVRRHAAAMFGGILGQARSLDLTRALARSLLADAATMVGRNDFLQRCKAWRGASDADQRAAVQLLIDANWLVPDDDSRPYSGWPHSRWFVNSRVHELFGEEGERHNARRKAVRDALLGQGGE